MRIPGFGRRAVAEHPTPGPPAPILRGRAGRGRTPAALAAPRAPASSRPALTPGWAALSARLLVGGRIVSFSMPGT